MITLPVSGDSARPRRWRSLSGRLSFVFLVVLLAHLMLLQGMSFGASPDRAAVPAVPGRVAPLQVRQFEPAAPVHRVQIAAAAVPVAAVAVAAMPAPLGPVAAAPPLRGAEPVKARAAASPVRGSAPPEPAAEDLQATVPEPGAALGPLQALKEAPAEALLLAAAAPPPRASGPAAPPAPRESGVSVPVYPTRLPPPVLLRYELKRGAISGSGELRWRPAEGRYQMEMEGAVFGVNALSWVSQGRLDAAGLAPERFVDRRRGRDALAANFQRDKGFITYSGAAAVHPLVPGAQDRLSFMLQLAAIVDAAPAKFGVGAKIAMFVTGARGDADVWTFTVEPADTLNVPAGRVPGAVHLRREPRKPYDTRAEVWLDPARSHLPVRVRLSSAERDEATDFLLREIGTP